MLVCAAPAPVTAPGALVARTDVSNECQKALVDLKAIVKVHADSLCKHFSYLRRFIRPKIPTTARTDACYNTNGCDCKPIVIKIVADIRACIDIIAKLKGTIDVGLVDIVQLVVDIILVSSPLVLPLAASNY